MQAKNLIIAFIIGFIILAILVFFYTKGLERASNIEEGFVNGTLEDPFSITGEAVREPPWIDPYRNIYKEESSIFEEEVIE